MAEHDESNEKAHADSLREEIRVLRGTVAALRATRRSAIETANDEVLRAIGRAWLLVAAIGFGFGVLLTLAVLEILHVIHR